MPSADRARLVTINPTRGYNSPKCHVWMPPFAQEDFERLDHVIGCGHVSGLQVRPDMAAGRYGDTRTWRKSLIRALSSLALVAFPGPDLTDHLTLPFVDLLTRPTFPKPRRLRLTQIAATAGTRKSSPFASMAQTERAILLASAIATSILGLRASMRWIQLPSGAPLRKAARTTVIAPMISRRRISRWPIFEIFPRTCLPPVECCRGTSPSQAAKSRPRLKTSIGGAKVSIARVVIGPTPGIVCRRRVVSPYVAS